METSKSWETIKNEHELNQKKAFENVMLEYDEKIKKSCETFRTAPEIIGQLMFLNDIINHLNTKLWHTVEKEGSQSVQDETVEEKNVQEDKE